MTNRNSKTFVSLAAITFFPDLRPLCLAAQKPGCMATAQLVPRELSVGCSSLLPGSKPSSFSALGPALASVAFPNCSSPLLRLLPSSCFLRVPMCVFVSLSLKYQYLETLLNPAQLLAGAFQSGSSNSAAAAVLCCAVMGEYELLGEEADSPLEATWSLASFSCPFFPADFLRFDFPPPPPNCFM